MPSKCTLDLDTDGTVECNLLPLEPVLEVEHVAKQTTKRPCFSFSFQQTRGEARQKMSSVLPPLDAFARPGSAKSRAKTRIVWSYVFLARVCLGTCRSTVPLIARLRAPHLGHQVNLDSSLKMIMLLGTSSAAILIFCCRPFLCSSLFLSTTHFHSHGTCGVKG